MPVCETSELAAPESGIECPTDLNTFSYGYSLKPENTGFIGF
jgi:hypothetical protein